MLNKGRLTEVVTPNKSRETAKNTVVSESFIKFTLVPSGVKIELNSCDKSLESSASFAKLLFQITEGKQNQNICKSIESKIEEESVRKHIFDIWQTLKLLDLKNKVKEEEKIKLVVRPSQVLQHSKGI